MLGRLTGRGNTANIELVLKARPDVTIDYASVTRPYRSLADRVQAQTGLPYFLIDGVFTKTARAYRLLGDLLGKAGRAAALAAYADSALAEATAMLHKVPRAQRPRVYYGRRVDGLETGLAGSINVEVLELLGARNVAAEGAGQGGIAPVSMEQILTWDPEVVLTLEPRFFRSIFSDPLWQSVEAVQRGGVYLAPNRSFGWCDRPPSANPLIGIKWLLAVLYPAYVGSDLRQVTREFYRMFYHADLNAS